METDQSNLSFAWNGTIIATQLLIYHNVHVQESRYTLAWEIRLQIGCHVKSLQVQRCLRSKIHTMSTTHILYPYQSEVLWRLFLFTLKWKTKKKCKIIVGTLTNMRGQESKRDVEIMWCLYLHNFISHLHHKSWYVLLMGYLSKFTCWVGKQHKTFYIDKHEWIT